MCKCTAEPHVDTHIKQYFSHVWPQQSSHFFTGSRIFLNWISADSPENAVSPLFFALWKNSLPSCPLLLREISPASLSFPITVRMWLGQDKDPSWRVYRCVGPSIGQFSGEGVLFSVLHPGDRRWAPPRGTRACLQRMTHTSWEQTPHCPPQRLQHWPPGYLTRELSSVGRLPTAPSQA